jgi:hypothetical protein
LLIKCLGRSMSQVMLSVWSLNTCAIYQRLLSTLGRSNCVREVEFHSDQAIKRTYIKPT